MSYKSAAVAVVAVLASASAVAVADRSPTSLPRTQLPSAEQAPPRETVLACPPPPPGADTATSVFAVSPAGKRANPAAGSIELAPLRRPPRPTLSTGTAAGRPLQRAAKPGDPALLISASGELARGASAAVFSVLDSNKTSGLAATSCGSASNDWWFSAVDTSVGATSRLVLSNPTRAVSVVDLAMFGYNGPIAPAGARGITVAPFSERSLDLSRFAPGSSGLTVNAHASRGSVVAAVLTTKRRRVTVAGSEWVSPSAGPRNQVVINPAPPMEADTPGGGRNAPGGAGNAPPSDGKQRLVLTNTSGRQALAHVRVFDSSGTFTPTELADVRIEPGSVVAEDLVPITQGQAAGVLVTSNVAVTGAITTTTSADTRDFTVSTSSEALTAPAVAPLLADSDLTLLLTTPDPVGGSLRVETFNGSGARVRNQAINVKGAAATVWEPPEGDDLSYLVLSPRAGEDISGAAFYRSADGITSLPVRSGVWSITRPAVVPVP